ncbi:MAG TPA: RusA family crossover junction endodeoxyribonuclease, partial [Bacteroidales bacterium]|nr:RusA family crossover junction endodeoxyribonuclease [Bacteroidales bacterium]
MADYAKVVVPGTPISKSNFKMVSKDGRFFMPHDTGSYSDRYAIYETTIALLARSQNPGIVFTESLMAILKVFYKSEKRHPDTNNITKSIFDGIEKSGLIINDAQVTRIVIEEYYDKENPRFELELYKESVFNLEFTVNSREEPFNSKSYEQPANTKGKMNPKKCTSRDQPLPEETKT